jgi:putative NADH-flavin reductase
MRVFMTGATGVIGRRVIPLLNAAGHQVTGVARTHAKRRQLERAGAVAADVNLFDAGSVRCALAGSMGEMLARSLRISNRKLRAESGWRPKYPSAREGWRAVVGEFNETALAA